MLSSKLVRLVEEHWEPLTARILADIRKDTRVRHIAGLPEGELRDRARDIFERLGHWLTVSGEHEVAQRFEHLGHMRHDEDVPLGEVVLCCIIIKNRLLELVRGQGIRENVVELYAEEELEHIVGQFFDSMIYHAVLGYEAAEHDRHAKAAVARR